MNEEYKAPLVEDIHKRMLNDVSNDYEKRTGTFACDLTKTYAIQSYEARKKIELVASKLDVRNYHDDELDRYVFQKKGMKRKKSNSAIGTVIVKGNGTVSIGDLFETEAGTQFKSIEIIAINGSGNVKVEAVIPGLEGNVGANAIILIPVTIQGITEVTNIASTIDGYDRETDESLVERYLIEIQKPATSGNRYHYMQWSREVVGVGDSKVYSLWDGNNTVQIVIIDDEKIPATAQLVERVQNYIDPKGENDSTWGGGYGQAPIGAYCSVISAIAKNINIASTLTLENGYTLEQVKPYVEEIIRKHLKEIAFLKTSVSYAILASKILNVDGIDDWTVFTINGVTKNINVGEKEVAILESVVLSE
ncbi:MAG: baseplate J/gp47 family protein [Psychrilyobacter sp.]|uniref:baseplate J/gp47 family protein n=1 Tax=Psychrilyobacter sp. TaxID=2586924 RepID=UPI003C768485